MEQVEMVPGIKDVRMIQKLQISRTNHNQKNQGCGRSESSSHEEEKREQGSMVSITPQSREFYGRMFFVHIGIVSALYKYK
jgi:hypothetical protein